MKNNKLIWIGIQESEIKDINDLFLGSITIFGSGKNNNYSFDKSFGIRYDYNKDCPEWFDFVNQSAIQLINSYDDCRFLLYYPMDAKDFCKELKARIVALNDFHILEVLDNKFSCRSWLCNSVPILPQQFVSGQNLINNVKKYIKSSLKTVIQGAHSCGGSNTFLFSKKSYKYILKSINSNDIYSVTQYVENNIPLNIHLAIYENEIQILPGSVQIISLNEYKFEYIGADFIAFQHLPENLKRKLLVYAKAIGQRLQHSGYKGIVGIDFIASKNEVYFMEINPRFQSSSFLLNKAFKDEETQISLQKLHLDCFESKICSYNVPDLKVKYSYRKFLFDRKQKNQIKYLMDCFKSCHDIKCEDDYLSWNMRLEDNTYLFKAIFNRNISAISPDFTLTWHPNIDYDKYIVNFDNFEECLQELKIMLLSHGVNINKNTLKILEKRGGVNYKEFYALDLILLDHIYINAPYKMNLAEISPFNIKLYNDNLWLYYFNKRLIEVKIRSVDYISEFVTTNGRKYNEISYLGNDRLRIYYRLGCYFQQHNIGCGFCDLDSDARKIDVLEIKEVIDKYKNASGINHYLIGGGSQSPNDDFATVCEISEYIRSFSDKPIYLMSLPPKNTAIFDRLKTAGITQVAFNLEIFDRELAKKYMPGKGQLSLERYTDAFDYSVRLWGRTGNVRTIFIVGLESQISLLKGIEYVCSRGVSPILSLYKPIENTPLSYLLPPPDEQIYDIVRKVEAICLKYNVPLGPSCRFCEDNTLKITI